MIPHEILPASVTTNLTSADETSPNKSSLNSTVANGGITGTSSPTTLIHYRPFTLTPLVIHNTIQSKALNFSARETPDLWPRGRRTSSWSWNRSPTISLLSLSPTFHCHPSQFTAWIMWSDFYDILIFFTNKIHNVFCLFSKIKKSLLYCLTFLWKLMSTYYETESDS